MGGNREDRAVGHRDDRAVSKRERGPRRAPSRSAAAPSDTEPAAHRSAAAPSDADSAPLLGNAELARIFYEIADLVELKGEIVFKAVAYRRAADAIAHSPVEVARAYREGNPPHLAGVGAAIDKKLAELAATGRLAFYERLQREVPPSLLDILAIQGVGPRTVKELHDDLGILTVADLERAARAGLLRGRKGMSARTEERILEGIAALQHAPGRMTLGQAEQHARHVIDGLTGAPGLSALTAAGSFRRRRETVGDLDILAETDRPAAVVERLTELPGVERVLSGGGAKGSVVLRDGPQVDLMTFPPGEGGTYLVHFTGSKEHNVRLRGMARDRGWSLSEKGFLHLGPDGEPLEGEPAELRTFGTEAEVYEFLGLPFIPPELREDRGEIEAALEGRLPRLVEQTDLQGDLHAHSDWSDGVHSPEEMVRAALARGYAYFALSDHSFGLGIARGLTVERVREQRALIDELNDRLDRERAAGKLPDGANPSGFRVLHGCELEIRADGGFDFDEETLAGFDIVTASLHQGRRQSRERLTERVLTAIRSPHIDAIGHPSGRLINERDELDLDWEAIYAEAARTGTLLEINASDHRLDLDDVRARRAREVGCRLVINSDAHRVEELDGLRWGVAVARRAWLAPDDVMNSRPLADLLDWLARRG